LGHFRKKKKIRIFELQKFESSGGCIAKIETLEVELKIALNFERIKCNFSKNKPHSFLGIIMETTLILFMKKFMHDQRRLQNAT
jgi:hypothetical protein